MLSTRQWQALRSFPFRLALVYLLVGAVYIVLSDRRLELTVNDPKRLTELQSYKGWAFVACTAILLYALASRFCRTIARAETHLESARLDYRRLLETTGEGVQILDQEGRTVFVNDRLCELTGMDRERLMAQGLDGAPAGESEEGTAVGRDEVHLRTPDGREVWMIVSQTAIVSASDEREGMLRVFTDNTTRRRALMDLSRALKTQRVLMSELDHRVRNNLASLVAIIEVSAAGKPALERFAGTITDRVRVMASGYTLLSRNQWRPVPLESLIGAVVSGDARCTLSGPPVTVGMDQVVPLMLVVFELFANARQHGSLSDPSGKLEVAWHERPSERGAGVRIEWREHGGRSQGEVGPPGFGLAVASGIASSELRGQLSYAFPKDGARISLEVQTNSAEMHVAKSAGGSSGLGAAASPAHAAC